MNNSSLEDAKIEFRKKITPYVRRTQKKERLLFFFDETHKLLEESVTFYLNSHPSQFLGMDRAEDYSEMLQKLKLGVPEICDEQMFNRLNNFREVRNRRQHKPFIDPSRDEVIAYVDVCNEFIKRLEGSHVVLSPSENLTNLPPDSLQTVVEPKEAKAPWVAALLSFFVLGGTGHIYIGQVGKGVVLIGLSVLTWITGILYIFSGFFFPCFFGFAPLFAIDAYLLAKKQNQGIQIDKHQFTPVGIIGSLLLIFISFAYLYLLVIIKGKSLLGIPLR